MPVEPTVSTRKNVPMNSARYLRMFCQPPQLFLRRGPPVCRLLEKSSSRKEQGVSRDRRPVA